MVPLCFWVWAGFHEVQGTGKGTSFSFPHQPPKMSQKGSVGGGILWTKSHEAQWSVGRKTTTVKCLLPLMKQAWWRKPSTCFPFQLYSDPLFLVASPHLLAFLHFMVPNTPETSCLCIQEVCFVSWDGRGITGGGGQDPTGIPHSIIKLHRFSSLVSLICHCSNLSSKEAQGRLHFWKDKRRRGPSVDNVWTQRERAWKGKGRDQSI